MTTKTISGLQIMDAAAAITWALNHNEANPGSIPTTSLVRLIRARRVLAGPQADIDALRKSLGEKYANGDGKIAEDKIEEANREFAEGMAAISEDVPALPVDVLGEFSEASTSIVMALEPLME